MQYTLKAISKDDWSKVNRFSNTFLTLTPGLDKAGNPRAILTDPKEENEFEAKLNLHPGALSRYSDFWDTFQVRVGKDGLVLDDTDPEDLLKIKFLKGDNLVACGAAELRTKPHAEFILSSPEEDAKVKNEGREHKKKAYSEFSKLTPNDMRDVLLLFGKTADDLSNDIVEDQLASLMEVDYKKFVNVVTDKNFAKKVLLTKAYNNGTVRRSAMSDHADFYFGEVLLGHDINEACEFLNLKSNTETYLGIKKELKEVVNNKV